MSLVIERLASDYLRNSYPFPNDGVKKKLKEQPDFFKRVGDAIMCQYVNNQCALPYTWGTKSRSITELRSYASGEQDVNKYKPLVCHSLNENGGKAYMNISWAAVRSIPLFRNVIKGLALKTSYKINVDALDPSSIADKKAEEAYWLLQTDPEWQAFSKEMQTRGVQVPKQQFQSEQQVNAWVKSGGLKLAVEIAMKTALEATLYISKFDDSVKIELIDDFIDLGIGITRDYIESGTRYVKSRYVDPACYIGRFSQFKDHHNSDYGAEIRLMTLGELRREAKLSDADLVKIARKYQQDYGNGGRFGTFGFYEFLGRYRNEYGDLPIDDMKVPVLDAVFASADIDFYTKVTRKGSGNLIYNEVDQDYKLPDKEREKGKSLEGKNNERLYKFKYLLDSDVVFDYGEDEDFAHDGKDGEKRVVIPYHVYNLQQPSIVDMLIPIEDDMCLTTYKWRNAKTRMLPPPAVAIETGLLSNLSMGGVKMTPKQSFSMGIETGYLGIQSLSDHGKAALSANSTPINPIQQNIYEYFRIYWEDMNALWSQAHKLTGINDLTAASAPSDRQGKGTMQMSVELSNNIIAPLFKGYEVVFEQTMRSCALRWQNVLRNGDVDGYYKAIGSTNLEVFKLSKNISSIDFGLVIESMPSEQEIEMLLAEITQLKSVNVQSGAGGISPESYLLIYRSIKKGNIDLAQLQLSQALHEQRMMDQQLAMQREQMNGQIQQQSLQASNLAKQAALEQEFGYKEKEILLQADIEKEADARQHLYAMEQIALKGQQSYEQKDLGVKGDLTKTLITQKKEKSESKK